MWYFAFSFLLNVLFGHRGPKKWKFSLKNIFHHIYFYFKVRFSYDWLIFWFIRFHIRLVGCFRFWCFCVVERCSYRASSSGFCRQYLALQPKTQIFTIDLRWFKFIRLYFWVRIPKNELVHCIVLKFLPTYFWPGTARSVGSSPLSKKRSISIRRYFI